MLPPASGFLLCEVFRSIGWQHPTEAKAREGHKPRLPAGSLCEDSGTRPLKAKAIREEEWDGRKPCDSVKEAGETQVEVR